MAVQRWTDEMLDELASSVADLRESVDTVRDSVDGLRITTQALLQVAAQNQQQMDRFEEEMELIKQKHAEDIALVRQRQAENDERFNILLEEVRYLVRGDREL